MGGLSGWRGKKPVVIQRPAGAQSRMKLLCLSTIGLLVFVAMDARARPQFDLGALLGNAVGATFDTAFGRDCKGRPQGDYFFGCQVKGKFLFVQFTASHLPSSKFHTSRLPTSLLSALARSTSGGSGPRWTRASSSTATRESEATLPAALLELCSTGTVEAHIHEPLSPSSPLANRCI